MNPPTEPATQDTYPTEPMLLFRYQPPPQPQDFTTTLVASPMDFTIRLSDIARPHVDFKDPSMIYMKYQDDWKKKTIVSQLLLKIEDSIN
jgi:hypothetical protein